MRIGTMEGTPEEIRDLCENHGLTITDYMDRPKDLQFSNRWLVGATLSYLALLVLTTVAPGLFPSAFGVLSLLTLVAVIGVAVCLQLRYDNKWASGLAAVGLGTVWLVAIGALAPQAAVEFFAKLGTDS